MHEYVVHRISQQDNRLYFFNNRCGRQNDPPLLHFTFGHLDGRLSTGLSFNRTQGPFTRGHSLFRKSTFEYLVEQGVDVNAVFNEQTALRYYGKYGWQPSVPMTFFLLEHGADPNISVGISYKRCPYLHLMVCWKGAKLKERLEMAAILHKHGVDFNKPDEDGVVLAEKLYSASGHFPRESWVWVLASGAKITRLMVCSGKLLLSHYDRRTGYQEAPVWNVDELIRPRENVLIPLERAGICDDVNYKRRHDARDILRLPKFRRREWYTGEAAELAEEMEPGWFMAGESEQTTTSSVLQTRSAPWKSGSLWR